MFAREHRVSRFTFHVLRFTIMLKLSSGQLKTMLLQDGLVRAEQVDAAIRDAEQLKQDSVAILVSRGIMTWDYFYSLLAKSLGVSRAALNGKSIDETVLKLIPEAMARDRRTIVFGRDATGTLLLAMEDPGDLQTIEFFKKYLHGHVAPFLATDDDLNKGYRLYSKQSTEDFKRIIEDNVRVTLQSGKSDASELAEDIPIVSIVDTILSYAVTSRASDIHIEVFENELLIRYRIDGILHEMVRVPKAAHAAIIARLKILSNLKLDEHMKPQDGRFRYKVGPTFMDARVSVIPTLYGEKIVMRILPATQRPYSFEEVGMLPDTVKIVKDNVSKSYGMVLVTGPTGSGKTTTLYTMLAMLNKPEVNIVTVEDPIEFGIPNVNQTQVNPVAGLTFATSLRSIVRQDPNVIMIGEIRDLETAEIAVHSSLTGSLVLSTLHTNNAATAIPRLLDIGIQPFLVAAVLNVVMAQRLVRRICLDCIASYKPDATTIELIREQLARSHIETFTPPKTLYRGKGCGLCNQLGYRGRIGIYEALQVTDAVRKLIPSPDFSLAVLEAQTRKDGMITMFEDGIRKAAQGLTTIEEVLRVIRE